MSNSRTAAARLGIRSLTGVEPHPTRPHTDLRTFQCLICNGVQASVVPADGDAQH